MVYKNKAVLKKQLARKDAIRAAQEAVDKCPSKAIVMKEDVNVV